MDEDIAIAVEQDWVNLLYRPRAPATGTPQALTERDAVAAMYSRQLADLDGVEQVRCSDRPNPGPLRAGILRAGRFTITCCSGASTVRGGSESTAQARVPQGAVIQFQLLLACLLWC